MSVFVDTGAWYASVVANDPRHADVVSWHRQNTQPLITTDYVIDEALTLLRSRGERAKAIALGRHLLDLSAVSIHFISESEIRQAWEIFRDNPSRDWSFTDCTSKVVIDARHIKQVLTFDHHFAEFGALEILPNVATK
ncbi:MAG: PIN domain-containing protein [Tepidisphaeraceae bacterium]|jgi:predicted nucleic acid-binding protein